MPRLGLPMSKVAVASCGPRENSSAGFGARSTYCAVTLATISYGRFWIRPTLALFGVKCRLRGVAGPMLAGAGVTADTSGVEAGGGPGGLTGVMAPANCALGGLRSF